MADRSPQDGDFVVVPRPDRQYDIHEYEIRSWRLAAGPYRTREQAEGQAIALATARGSHAWFEANIGLFRSLL